MPPDVGSLAACLSSVPDVLGKRQIELGLQNNRTDVMEEECSQLDSTVVSVPVAFSR